SATTGEACLLSALMELVATTHFRFAAVPASIHAANASSGAKQQTEPAAFAAAGACGNPPCSHVTPSSAACGLRESARTETPARTSSGSRKKPIWLLAPHTSTERSRQLSMCARSGCGGSQARNGRSGIHAGARARENEMSGHAAITDDRTSHDGVLHPPR